MEESGKRQDCIWRWRMTAAVSSRTRLCVGARHGPVSNVAGSCRVQHVILASLPDGGVAVEENGPWWRGRR